MSEQPTTSNEAKNSTPSGTATPVKKKNPLAGKKVSEEILLKRKLGRIKAAENMAIKIKNSGIEKVENKLINSLFQPIPLINQKNYYTDYLKKDDQIIYLRKRKEMFGMKKGRKSNLEKQQEKLKSESVAPPTPSAPTPLVGNSKGETPMDIDDDDDDDDDNEMEENGGTVSGTPAAVAQDAEKRAKSLRTIAIHPGSRNIRIGFVNEAYPKTFPNVIAIPNHDQATTHETLPRRRNSQKSSSQDTNGNNTEDEDALLFGEKFNNAKKMVQRDFKERMRFYKRRILPNSNETVKNFNNKVRSEIISDLNDPHKIDWTNNNDESIKDKSYLVGENALKLANNQRFKLRYPIVNGKFNENPNDYNSPTELVGDIQLILSEILTKEFSVDNFQNFNIVLVIPDLYDKTHVETWIYLILQMNFNAISIIQETMAATFGAGVSQACVVDIGAQTTSVSCIDEGMVINDSRIQLDYGGDDITKAFSKMIVQSGFPYKEFDYGNVHDWKLVNDLKEKFSTFEDANIAVQLYDFIKRKPGSKTEKFQFKVFDEVMLSPMGLFYPEIFELEDPESDGNKLQTKQSKFRLFSKSSDSYTGKSNNPTSMGQKKSLTNDLYVNTPDEEIVKKLILMDNDDLNPNNSNLKKNDLTHDEELKISHTKLDFAIIESITNACKHDLGNCKKFYENILIVGGVAKTPSIDLIVTDRINIWRPQILSISNVYEILKILNEEFEQEKSKIAANSGNSEEGQHKLDDAESMKLLTSIIKRRLPGIVESPQFVDQLNTIQVLSPPRDIDPQILTWKGAAVFARLKIVQELWITKSDWDLLGNRALHYKALFSY
ncbi:Arp8 protein [Saccharomycopsis crataegensis]|uniref:Arp8 protein n=1 Tax=Saccharomycopsis crataegensis TaxID=43959 RepID=A0AAV5QTX4_9ASCO|nr:Arp8 protein [Saccharomycopsis crataegensis]